MSQFTDRLERDLREIAAGANPSPSAWESIAARLGDNAESEAPLVITRAPDTSKRPLWIAAAAALVVFTGSIAVLATRDGDDRSISPAESDATIPPTVSSPAPGTVPTLAPGTSGGMWPQSTLDEVRFAQEFADAGDPGYTWQLDTKLAADEEPWGAEIFARFIEEELGWEAFTFASVAGYSYADSGGDYDGVTFIRCAPGQTNPLSGLYAEAPVEIRGCAPTIDELTYETVGISVHQPERRGPSGIWVVDRWEILAPRLNSSSFFDLLYPDFSMSQIAQSVPPSDAEVTALLQDFLQARIDGAAAEQFLLQMEDLPDNQVPLLYATTGGAAYERFETELVQVPVWPNGLMEYEVRLFAGETVVEQYFQVVGDEGGQLWLVYGYSTPVPTTENGQPVPVQFKEFGGTVTFIAPPPKIASGDGSIAIGLSATGPEPIRLTAGDGQGCEDGAVPADAEAMARSIMDDPNFETTETVPLTAAGIDGLQMDVAFTEQDLCYELWPAGRLPTGDPGWRIRLYLINYPDDLASPSGSTWRPHILTIAVVASEADFQLMLEAATPIVQSILESLEFHPGD